MINGKTGKIHYFITDIRMAKRWTTRYWISIVIKEMQVKTTNSTIQNDKASVHKAVEKLKRSYTMNQ